MIPQLSREIEQPFRDALGHAIRNEIDEMEQGLLRLTDEQIFFCLTLCVHVAGHIVIDVCGNQWPDEDNQRRIGNAAPRSRSSREFGLTAEDAYAYVKRVVLGGERLDQVFSPPERAATLAFFITGQLLGAYHLPEEKWWDYLTRIEEAYEVAQATDLDLLPPLMLRARREAAAAKTGNPSSPA